MFKFITLALICMIVLAGVDAAKLQSKNTVKAKTQAKAVAAAFEELKETLDEMEENGEIENADFDFMGALNKGIGNLKRMFHFWNIMN